MRTALPPRGRRSRVLLAVLVAAALAAAPAAVAQNPTGTLTGTVTGPDGQGLPGVTVTAASPHLQGERIAVTGPNGSYKLAFLPPGDYRLSYELDSFATITRDVKISAAVTTPSDVAMQLAAVEETIEVTGQQAAISETATGSTTITQKEVEALPIDRDLDSVVDLTPGVHATGPRQAGADRANITIAGAMSFENLWTLNGVVINENVRGQELPLFIEDAIQETTTQVSGISAEYGRFQGGVINAITKSGGNEFSGSFRVNLTNDDWEESTPLSVEPEDSINESYEATLGGYVWKDHLWFFAAGRDESSEERASLPFTNLPVDQTEEQTRLEGKLTGTLADAHTVVASYLEIDEMETGDFFNNSIDPLSVTDREDPQEITSLNYTGILAPSFFVEAQYSEREFQIGKGSGARSRTLEEGTLMRTNSGPYRYYTPTFCGVCEQEERNNENWLAKGSWFVSTESLGTHDLAFGYDTFSDIRFSVNHQTGSDFTVWDTDFTVIGEEVFPTIYPCAAGQSGCDTTSGDNPGTFDAASIGWWAVFNLDDVQPTDFETSSLYVNDRWQLDSNWAFNVGVRYDQTSGTNGGGVEVLDDEKVSPRLGLTWDVHGDGDLVAHANYGTYVAAPTNTIADSTSSGGAIGLFESLYGGPALNTQCGAGGPCLSTREVLTEIFAWYLANGGTTDLGDDLTGLPNLVSVSIPGETSMIRGTLKSPSADEIAVGVTKRLGARGLVRADVVRREYGDFYSNRIDLGTGQVPTAQGPADLTLVGNFGDGVLEREYLGLHMQARYRITDRLSAAANYTLSELEGNIEGETAAGGPGEDLSPREYPEYHQSSWAFPVGKLDGDQTHKLRAWLVYDVFDREHHSLSVSLLQSYQSGQSYSLFAEVDSGRYVTNPGYETPPDGIDYYFGGRGVDTFDDITSTDLSLNYAFLWNAFGRQVEVFVQPEVRNVFDEDGLLEFDTRIRTFDEANDDTACNGGPCQPFDPFTETPVEGVHWAKRDTFGQPLAEDDFQDPREFRFSVGFRF
jgi:outer membrane receptor protein involved in Fe transport